MKTFSWEMAEALALAHMKNVGFSDAQKTESGSDKGLDVIAADGVAQVKALQAPVGRPDLQKLKGAAQGYKHLLFYSLSGYTSQAIEYAEESGVALFTFDRANNVKAVNTSARWIDGSESPRVEALQAKLTANDLVGEMKEFAALSNELMTWLKLSPWTYLVPQERQQECLIFTTTLLLTTQSLSMEALSISSSPDQISSFLERAREEMADIVESLGKSIDVNFSGLNAGEAVNALRESVRSHTDRVLVQEMTEPMKANFKDVPSAWNFYLPIIAVFVRAQKFLKASNAEFSNFESANAIDDIDDDPRFSERRAQLKSEVGEFSTWLNKALEEGEGSPIEGEQLFLRIVQAHQSMAAEIGTDASKTLAYSDAQPVTWLDDDEDEDEDDD